MTASLRHSFKFAIILLLIGALISGFLILQHFNQTHEMSLMSMMCGDNVASGCNAVNRSEYSTFFGMPIASLGLWFYLSCAFLLFLASFSSSDVKYLAGRICYLGLCAALMIDAGLFAVQFFELKSFCNLCMTTYVVTLLGALQLRTYRKRGTGKLNEILKTPEGRILAGGWTAGEVLLVMAVGAGTLALDYRDPTTIEARFNATAILEFQQSPMREFNLTEIPMQGAVDAKIRIVVFSDFLCPWCRQVAQSFDQFMPRWKDRVAVYYKNFPLDAFCNPYQKTTTHPGACWAVLGGVCAEEQGKFWDYHDYIFKLPPRNPNSMAVMKLAAEAGLDTNALATCMHSVATQRKVRDQISEAHELGIDGTPRVFINGRKLPKLSYLTSVLSFEAKRLGLAPLEGLKE